MAVSCKVVITITEDKTGVLEEWGYTSASNNFKDTPRFILDSLVSGALERAKNGINERLTIIKGDADNA